MVTPGATASGWPPPPGYAAKPRHVPFFRVRLAHAQPQRVADVQPGVRQVEIAAPVEAQLQRLIP